MIVNEEPDPDWRVRADNDFDGYQEDLRLGRIKPNRPTRFWRKYEFPCHECGSTICHCYDLNTKTMKWEPTSKAFTREELETMERPAGTGWKVGVGWREHLYGIKERNGHARSNN